MLVGDGSMEIAILITRFDMAGSQHPTLPVRRPLDLLARLAGKAPRRHSLRRVPVVGHRVPANLDRWLLSLLLHHARNDATLRAAAANHLQHPRSCSTLDERPLQHAQVSESVKIAPPGSSPHGPLPSCGGVDSGRWRRRCPNLNRQRHGRNAAVSQRARLDRNCLPRETVLAILPARLPLASAGLSSQGRSPCAIITEAKSAPPNFGIAHYRRSI